ncbi:MAG: response regulator transcription factor [Bacteroidetes bacterium]|uniref:Response regulator transcription factor n=1 Tax=Phaeocystidibacter marisrubri TaxID=1577780 RepID=A0A6L3ZIU6_9FLAO|nr:LytTR family DNA-binding domain-containing protein [Phaeocystidibacter marisrubri]KAB2817932.1 response regulator transcription factor [Phaeocystidibacter marisrubri]TNE28865.1 MAG: response regulator transcription factor [Bacteroidota bacterium]GGH72808.1 DNA-binding response regulator [Phaeocystidibacter marisrubri]
MSTLRTIIIEDDPIAQKNLEHLCSKDDRLELLKCFGNSEDAIDFMTSNDVDLIFLDVELPGESGLDMLENSPALPQVIFATSNKEYAFDAFQFEATDFLKKPISAGKFEMSVSKAAKRAEEAPTRREKPNYIFVKSDGRLVRIMIQDILFIENVGDYVKVVTSNGNYITYNTMRAVDAKLSDYDFFKVHRSFIVNLSKVVDIEDNSLVIGTTVIPISRSNRQGLMDRLNLL